MRNGNYVTDLRGLKKDRSLRELIPSDRGEKKTPRELSQLRKDQLVMRIPVFTDEQIHFADYEPCQGEIPFDTTLHFSHGTVIVCGAMCSSVPLSATTTREDTPCHQHSILLFNTCNVMEMSGQNNGRLFATDSLEVSFDLPEGATHVRLRYLSTGHGGWGGGDEFNPKENVLYIDGVKRFAYTPWRCDCATFRDQNPVSGNFWNGVSSSDYSRSGWCPGMATNPVYVDLIDLKPGRHTFRIAIPQGPDEGGGFSHWMVSGTVLYEKR